MNARSFEYSCSINEHKLTRIIHTKKTSIHNPKSSRRGCYFSRLYCSLKYTSCELHILSFHYSCSTFNVWNKLSKHCHLHNQFYLNFLYNLLSFSMLHCTNHVATYVTKTFNLDWFSRFQRRAPPARPP